jgi:hypothetical protein
LQANNILFPRELLLAYHQFIVRNWFPVIPVAFDIIGNWIIDKNFGLSLCSPHVAQVSFISFVPPVPTINNSKQKRKQAQMGGLGLGLFLFFFSIFFFFELDGSESEGEDYITYNKSTREKKKKKN